MGRKLAIMLDKEWAGPLPIYSYLIEHPEGLFVVDTGDSARNSLKNYLPRTNPFFQYAVQIKVAPEEEIGPRLTEMGIDSARAEPSVLLPAHDPDAATRFAHRQCMFDDQLDAKDAAGNVANNAKKTVRA